jgi:hypothetical protein
MNPIMILDYILDPRGAVKRIIVLIHHFTAGEAVKCKCVMDDCHLHCAAHRR